MDGYFYLHQNGDLIYKRDLGDTATDLRDSDLVKMFWFVDKTDRSNAWTILVEGLAAGARIERVQALARKWGCNDTDAQRYAERIGAVLERDGEPWCATRTDFQNLAESPCGYGDTALEALADLAKSVGYKPQKLWGASFADLLKAPERARRTTP